jgi:anti-sigma factor RsiW
MFIHPPNEAIDDELLSAYLDGQVTPQDQERVEAVLAGDAALANSLATLRYTKTLLAAAPRVPAPRPFTLNEAMIGRSRPRSGWLAWLQPATLRGAAALAAVMLLVLVLGDVGVRTETITPLQTAQVQTEMGGLTPEEGDPTAIIAKAPSEAAVAAPGFLGLPPTTLLALQVGLAILVVVLLAGAWQLSRAP